MENVTEPTPEQTEAKNLSCVYFLLAIALAMVLYITGVNFIGEEKIQLWTMRVICVCILTFLINKVLPKPQYKKDAING